MIPKMGGEWPRSRLISSNRLKASRRDWLARPENENMLRGTRPLQRLNLDFFKKLFS
jgi:hypothetical protein